MAKSTEELLEEVEKALEEQLKSDPWDEARK
jgi:hypothetical protein